MRMLMATRSRSSILLAFIVGLVIFAPTLVSAQKNDFAIARADAEPNGQGQWQIKLNFTKNYDTATAKDPNNFLVIDVLRVQRIPVITAVPSFLPAVQHDTAGTLLLLLDPSARLDAGKVYHIYIVGLTFDGKSATNQLQKGVSVDEKPADAPIMPGPVPTASPSQVKEDDTPRAEVTAADGREDSNIYLSGQLTGASGEHVHASADIKLEYPFWITGKPNKKGHIRLYKLFPSFDLKASTDPGADPDSMNFALNFEFAPWKYGGESFSVPFRRLVWRNTGKIESDTDFHNTNALWETRFTLISKSYVSERKTLYFRPFLGHELGVNVNSPVKAAERRFLYRPLVGSTLNLIFPFTAGLQDLGFEVSYIRRFPLQREVSFEEDDDHKLVPIRFGRSPRDYIKAGINLNFTKAFGSTLSYEYGSLPPLYKLVDHKFSIGLTYKIKFTHE